MNMIYQTIRILFNLCFLRKSPADLPYSLVMLLVLIAIGVGINFFTLVQLKGASLGEVFFASVISLGIIIGLIYFLLSHRKVGKRLNKVLVSWFGTEILLTAMLKIVLLVTPENIQAENVVQIIFQIGFFTWNVVIKAYIVQRSCDIKMVSALLITFGILVVSSLPIQFILGPYLADTISQT